MATNEPIALSEVRARLERELPPGVLEHSHRTAELARELAVFHGVNADRAELAGLLHDVADRFSDAELLELAKRYGIPVSPTEASLPKLLHGAIGAHVLRDGWSVDEEVLDAVRDHVTATEHMGPLAKVIFLANKLEPGRDRPHGGLDPIRELAKKDLDEAMLHLHTPHTAPEATPLNNRLAAAVQANPRQSP